MKKQFTVILILLHLSKANAQHTIGDFNFETKYAIKIDAGYSMLEPLKLKANNSFGSIGYNYTHKIYGDGVKDPYIILQLNPFFSYSSMYNDSLNYPVNLLGSGSFNFNPRLYFVGQPSTDLMIYWYGGAGIKFIPPRKTENGNNHKFLGNAIEQRFFNFGVGFKYLELLNINASYQHHWHDLSTRTKKYYQAEIDPSLYSRSYNIFAAFNLWKPDEGKNFNLMAYGDFVSFTNDFNKARLFSFGLTAKIIWDGVSKTTDAKAPKNGTNQKPGSKEAEGNPQDVQQK